MGWLRARECGRLCRLQSVSIASVSLVLTEHALERGPAGLQSACFPGKTEQCEVVTEVRDKQRTLSNFGICNPKPHTFFFPSCFQRQKVPWQLAFDKGTHGKAPARNMLLTKASYSPSPCNLNCLCKAGCGSLWLQSQSWEDGGKSILSYRSSSRLAWTVWDPNSKQQSKTIVLFRDDFYNHLLPVFCGHLSGNPCFLPSRASCVPPPQPSWISWPY